MANFAQSFIKNLIPKRVSDDVNSVFFTSKVYHALGGFSNDEVAVGLQKELADNVFTFVGSFFGYTTSSDGLGILIGYLTGGFTPNEFYRKQVVETRTKCVSYLQTKGIKV